MPKEMNRWTCLLFYVKQREAHVGIVEPFARRKPTACGDCEKQFLGLTEPLLWIQLVAERSLSFQRALGVSITSARRVNVESSTFQ